MNDVPDSTRSAVRAYEAASERLAERGLPDAENGRAMVAAGLSRWSRAMPPETLVEEVSKMVMGMAHVMGVDMTAEQPEKPSSH
jgi:hypothetical protein